MMKKICIVLIFLFCFIFAGCEKEYEFVDDVYNISADSEVIVKHLRKIILSYEYKRLTSNLKLPEAVEGEILIDWSISECDYVVISENNVGKFLSITRDETEFIHFKLYAKINIKGEDGIRYWDCYISPLCYSEW